MVRDNISPFIFTVKHVCQEELDSHSGKTSHFFNS